VCAFSRRFGARDFPAFWRASFSGVLVREFFRRFRRKQRKKDYSKSVRIQNSDLCWSAVASDASNTNRGDYRNSGKQKRQSASKSSAGSRGNSGRRKDQAASRMFRQGLGPTGTSARRAWRGRRVLIHLRTHHSSAVSRGTSGSFEATFTCCFSVVSVH
jgi:hypothetical protein